jgi:lysophospholipase L1-like esterase
VERTAGIFSVVLASTVAACGSDFEVTPGSGSSFGQFAVTARGPGIARATDPIKIKVGGLSALGVERIDGSTVRFTVQGSPEPGEQPILVTGAHGETATGTLHFDAPIDPRFRRFVAFGASLTEGVQDLSIRSHGQLHGPAAQLARAMGAYLSLALMRDDFIPALEVGDFDQTTCRFMGDDPADVIEKRGLEDVLPKLVDRNGDLHVDWVRLDPNVEVRNVAVGGLKIGEVGGGASKVVERMFEHFIWDPFVKDAALLDAPKETMLDRVIAMKPTIIISTDLFANDFLVGFGGADIPDTSLIPPVETFDTVLEEILVRIDATGAETFIGTCPDVTLLRDALDKVDALRAAGRSEAEATGWTEIIRRGIAAYNDHLRTAATRHPRLHVVEVGELLDRGLAQGFDVAGMHLDPKPFGGLLSLDGQHFSDTGYAVLAEEYVKAINESLRTKIPDIDIADVLASDPYSIARLKERGFECAGR